MENNNNNSINKKKNYNKIFWSISSILFAGIVVVGGVFAYKLITDSNSSNNSINSEDTLLFTSRHISNFINLKLNKDKYEYQYGGNNSKINIINNILSITYDGDNTITFAD